MNICRLDFWDVYDVRSDGNMFIIPVNGSINKQHEAVMGRGLAKDAAMRYPTLRAKFGKLLYTAQRHRVHEMVEEQFILFPVKYEWHEPADIRLIAESCRQTSLLSRVRKYKMVYMPHVGCGNGQLDWETKVKRVIEKNMTAPYVIIRPK